MFPGRLGGRITIVPIMVGCLTDLEPRNSNTQQIMVTGLQHHNQPPKPPIYIRLMVVLACVAKG